MKLLLSILLCTIIRHSLSASFDPYTGEEIVEAVEGSDEYEYYSDGEGYDGYEYETEAAAVEEQEYIPPGYLAPSVPTAVLIFKPILNNKFIEDVSEHYNCLPQKDMMTSNILDLKKKGQDVDPAPVPEEAPPSDEKKVEKKLSFREIQEEKLRVSRERIKVEQIVYKHRLGSSCESSVCGACRILVEEFASSVVRNIDNSTIRYIRQLASLDFCDSKEIVNKYRPLVHHLCTDNFISGSNQKGYADALVQPFEEEKDWKSVTNPIKLHDTIKKVCSVVGACDKEHFEIQLKPTKKEEEHWDDRCYVCQAFAKNLEQRIGLTMHVTENTVVPITAQTCARMRLEPKLDVICQELVQGKMLDDVAWLAKIHGEKVERKVVSLQRFSDSLCEEIHYCSKYVDPEVLQAQEEIVPIFF